MKLTHVNSILLAVAITVILVTSVTLSGSLLAAGTAVVSVSAPAQPVSSGNQFTINIIVQPNTAIAGAQFNLSFNPSLVSVNSVTEGNLFTQGGASTYFMPGTINNNTGNVTGVAGAIITPGKTVSTTGTLAVITITARTSKATSTLTLSNVIVGDINGQSVSASVVNSQVVINNGTTTTPPPSGGDSGGGAGSGGGGGGITGPITVAGITDVTGIVDSKGVFSQITNAWSDDKKVVLNIPVNTTGLSASGAPLTQLSIIKMTTIPAFTAGAGMVSLPYDCTPSGVTFNPPATIRFSYDPALIPAGVAETSLQIAYYDSTVNSWITLPSTFDTDSHFIYALITHFTAYAVTYGVKAVTPIPTTTTTTPTTTEVVTTTTPPSSTTTSLPPKTTTTSLPPVTTTPVITQHPSTFEASSLLINPSTVKPDENVDIHLKITNTGDVTGTDTVVLRVNNVIVDSKDITLDGGTSTTITFTTSSKLPGNYTIEASGLKGKFTVSKSATVDWFWLIAIGAFLGGTTLAVSFVMLSKRNN